MDDKEQTESYAKEIDKVTDYFIKEFSLSYAVVVGVLVIKIISIVVRKQNEN